MPPPGFKSLSLQDSVIDDVYRVYHEVLAIGTRGLPSSVVPEDYVGKVPVTLGMVIRMGALLLEKEIKKKQAGAKSR